MSTSKTLGAMDGASIVIAGPADRRNAEECRPWCDPAECLAKSLTAARRHRSAPTSLELQKNDPTGTRLDMRVTESVFQPGELGLEIDVYSNDDDEPKHSVMISRMNLARLSRASLELVLHAMIQESSPEGTSLGLRL